MAYRRHDRIPHWAGDSPSIFDDGGDSGGILEALVASLGGAPDGIPQSGLEEMKAVIHQEAEECQTIFGGSDNIPDRLVRALSRHIEGANSPFDQLQGLALKHGYEISNRSQLNAAALRRFIEYREPGMATLAAKVMQDCGVLTRLDVGDLEFTRHDSCIDGTSKAMEDRIYAFSERKLFVKTIGDDGFGVVATWHKEAYWQKWHKIESYWNKGLDLTAMMRSFNPEAAEKIIKSEDGAYGWNTVFGVSSWPHRPRIEMPSSVRSILGTFRIHEPDLELPDEPPHVPIPENPRV